MNESVLLAFVALLFIGSVIVMFVKMGAGGPNNNELRRKQIQRRLKEIEAAKNDTQDHS